MTHLLDRWEFPFGINCKKKKKSYYATCKYLEGHSGDAVGIDGAAKLMQSYLAAKVDGHQDCST